MLGGPVAPAHAQSPAIHYIYDELNRLVGVIDQQGNAATYTYDAVGNLLRIDRLDADQIPGPVAITLVAPDRGKAGTVVEIFGKGFSAVAEQNAITFNGTLAAVSDAAPNRLRTVVPPGATTGPIAVTTPLGSAASPSPFRVSGNLTVIPATATVVANGTQQFEAREDNIPTTLVRWAVNGIPGGDPSIGTITQEGLFRAPALSPPPTVTVDAAHADDPGVTASATVTILPPLQAFLTAVPVSVVVGEPAVAVDRNITVNVSVRVAEPVVAVDRNVVANVSVHVAEADARFAAAPLVTVSREPVITAISPATGSPGTNVSITISGAGLGAVTSLVFLLDNEADSSIVAGNLAVNGEGTELTADIAIDSSALLGGRVVQVVTAMPAPHRRAPAATSSRLNDAVEQGGGYGSGHHRERLRAPGARRCAGFRTDLRER
ncbi:MAG: IPT/TIG domain-containing protein [Candidatus Rokuibacteriota bacterium]